MWGESSKNCEINCQCSGLITDSFKINSGGNGTKRKQEDAIATNFKLKMNPHSLDFKSPLQSPIITPKRRILGEITNQINSPLRLKTEHNSALLQNSPITSRSLKRTTNKISRIFEERSKFKMANKENNGSIGNERVIKFDLEEETRDCSFGSFSSCSETITNWSMTKLNFTDALQTKTEQRKPESFDMYVPEKAMETEIDEFETLHDLEEEFEADNFDQCTKYEIISTDSPNIISRGRSSSSRKVTSKNFVFGAPLADEEQSTSFNKPVTANATRMLNFGDENFEFTSPPARKFATSFSVKKSLKFSEPSSPVYPSTSQTPTKLDTPKRNPLRHEKSDSSIGSMASSPSSSQLRLFSAESMTSMESGFISELEEPFLELEASTDSPKMPNFNELLSGQIKDNAITRNFMKRPSLQRSLSFNPEPKARLSLFGEKDSPEGRKQKRESEIENSSCKKRKNSSPEKVEKVQRPTLHRAFSENHASIMSALARSSDEPDLIGDFSLPYILPLTGGDHSDLKSISCDTLADLLRGDFDDQVEDYQIIDCRYPYEFEGGHIPGAKNLYTPALVQKLLQESLPPKGNNKRSILVFHCEFSIERGPKLYRYLRSSDRSKNMENYPYLNYPEIYLLHKGYRTFYQKYPELCTPGGYTAMLDPKHSHLLKKHRSIEEPTSFFTHHRKAGHRLLY